MLKSAVFLDRDGVINKDYGYVYQIKDIDWVEGAIDTIKLLNRMQYLVFVVTNQSGIGRNFYSETDVKNLHVWMKDYLLQKDALISDFRYCPHHPEASINKYKKRCRCRKPAPGMILSLIKNWGLDTETSFLIGDKDTDIEAAKNAGINGFKFSCKNLLKFTHNSLKLLS